LRRTDPPIVEGGVTHRKDAPCTRPDSDRASASGITGYRACGI